MSGKANPSPGVEHILDRVREQMNPCIQCGTCSASCPNQEFMDLTPRQMWRMVLAKETDTLFDSLSFTMCSACYWCTLRCPRGLPTTHAMEELKQAGALMARPKTRSSDLFYRLFLDNVRQYGRIREMELMGRFFLGMKNPVTPIAYAPLGMALMRRKKIWPKLPSRGPGKLDRLFDGVAAGGDR
jgi:heterodisulfide reductase subunit C